MFSGCSKVFAFQFNQVKSLYYWNAKSIITAASVYLPFAINFISEESPSLFILSPICSAALLKRRYPAIVITEQTNIT